MKVVWAVIRREYLQRVRTKWFVLTTAAAPVLLLALLLGPVWLDSRSDAARDRLVVLDRTGLLYDGLAGRLAEAGYEVEPAEGTGPGAEAEALRRVGDEEVGALLVLDQATRSRGEARLVSRSRPSALRQALVRQALVQTILDERLSAQGVDVDALLGGGALEVDILAGEEVDLEDPAFMTVYAGTFLLYMTLLFYAVSVMRSVLEEKTSRIVEVVISSLRPWQLMLGKILGVGAVGLTQLGIWAAFAALLAGAGLPALVASRPELAGFGGLGDALPGPGLAALFLVFFLGGYFIFAGLYAAVGAMCSSEQEAQQAQTPLVILLVIPVAILVGVMQAPSSPVSVALSLVPFFSPFLMFARAGMGAAPAWQIALSVVLMAVTVVAVAWVAGRIYRVGILMAGKRPTLPELWRWVRES